MTHIILLVRILKKWTFWTKMDQIVLSLDTAVPRVILFYNHLFLSRISSICIFQ